MTPPTHLVDEAMIEAALGDQHGTPMRGAGLLFLAAEAELLLLVAELDNPSPLATAERRAGAIHLAAEMSRFRRRLQDMLL